MEERDNSNKQGPWSGPRPEDLPYGPPPQYYCLGARSELLKDPRWGGLPPVGEKPILNPTWFVVELILLMIFEIIIWAAYRYLSAPIIGTAFSYTFFAFHIFAAPVIHLVPIFLYWRFRLGEHGLPFLFTRKNLFTAVLMGLTGAVILYILNHLFTLGILGAAGFISERPIVLIADWLAAEPGWFVLMMFTFFFIVGPVEELQHRGFLQDQINRVNKPFVGIFISAFFFGAGHLPIYFILYQLRPEIAAITVLYTFSFGLLMSVFYHWSRNIIGPIVLHGFWDWQLFVYFLSIQYQNITVDTSVLFSFLDWLSSALGMVFLVVMFYFAYRLWWKCSRPAGSLGFQVRFISALFESDGFFVRTGRGIKNFFIMKRAQYYDTYNAPTQKTIIFVGVMILIFSGSVMGVSALAGQPPFEPLADQSELDAGGSASSVEPIAIEETASGYTNEQQTSELPISIFEEKLVEIRCTLTWQDEPSQYFQGSNQPDEFKLSIIAPSGEPITESEFSTSGSVTAAVDIDYQEPDFKTNYLGEWVIQIEAGDCGDDESSFGFRQTPDNGNDWTLDYSYTYMGIPGIEERDG